MKKIIDNKIYDTEKATKIYEFRRRCKGSECIFLPGKFYVYWTNVQVYKTSKNNYFLHYDEYDNYKEKIETITEDEVKEIIKDIDPNKYIELFGMIDLEEA